MPVLTDWIDTGHFPHQIQEWTTELLTGLLIFAGVHVLIRQSDRLRQLASTDALTGLRNRSCFEADLHAIKRRIRTKGPTILVYLDLDGFKELNDRCGHLAGDELLRQIGRALTDRLREGDTSYRLGGDEFAVLLRARNEQEGLGIVARALAAVQSSFFATTCSMGAVKIRSGEAIEDIIAAADTRMYAAKNGRGQQVEHRMAATAEIGAASEPRSSFIQCKEWPKQVGVA